jgi:hypothetical protein
MFELLNKPLSKFGFAGVDNFDDGSFAQKLVHEFNNPGDESFTLIVAKQGIQVHFYSDCDESEGGFVLPCQLPSGAAVLLATEVARNLMTLEEIEGAETYLKLLGFDAL